MKTEETIKIFSEKALLDKLYGYAYHRCSTSYEAQDLCSEIILAVLRSVRSGIEIENFNAYLWAVAHRTYADFCDKRKKQADTLVDTEYCNSIFCGEENPIENYIEKQDEKDMLKSIVHEISFLSKIYRDVMVMYYLDEKKVSEIAKELKISETTVKQRLFSARNMIKKEVKKMDKRNLSLKSVNLVFIGTGNPVGNDPSEKAKERLLSQNLVYLCKDSAKTIKELSESLNVPMQFVENEVEIQCNGLNGRYGLLRKLDKDKYISNILILKVKEYYQACGIYEKYLKEFCLCLKKAVEKSKDRILSFPFLSKQNNEKFILWALLPNILGNLWCQVNKVLADDYFSDVVPVNRDFTTVAIAVGQDEMLNMGFYGCDGVTANNLCGYERVFISNIYSDRIEKHFGCGHNLSTDPQILLTIRSIGGLDYTLLSEHEKEIAAKCIECGYLRKNGNVLEPKILVTMEEELPEFYNLLSDFDGDFKIIAGKIAGDIAVFVKEHIPIHLQEEYLYYNMLASSRMIRGVVEEGIREGLLIPPENKICAEGIIMAVKKQ